MKLSEFGVRWPVTTSMIFIAIIVLGVFSFTLVGLDLMPDFDVPVVIVVTSYSGAGPQEVETRITKIIESQVSAVENVDEVKSFSMEGVSLVTIKFDWGIDMGIATNDIRDKIDRIKKVLPDDADDPILMKIDLSQVPVLIYGVTAKESWLKINKIVDDKIVDKLKRVPGVATVTAQGGSRRVVHVRLNAESLRATGITGKEIVRMLGAQNLSNPGGHIRSGATDFLIRTPEEFTSVSQIGEVVLRDDPIISEKTGIGRGGVIKVKDVAEVEDGFEEKTEEVFMNGLQVRGLMVQKQSGGNTVSVANTVKKYIPNLYKDLPADVKIMEFIDTSTFIQNTVDNLKNSLLFGGICVFFVILFFIRDFRASIIIAVSIPTSLIITFLLMYLNDYTLNQISLSSLVIAIGMVVDNAIVVLDNVKRYLERGVKETESASWGASEMSSAVIASTLTSVAIFFPIMFTEGITKIFFGQLAAIVSMALLSSLISALLLTPMLCSKLLKTRKEGDIEPAWSAKIGGWLSKLENLYAHALTFVLGHRLAAIIGVCAALLICVALVPYVGVEFMPDQDQGSFTVKLELDVGTRFEITGAIVKEVRDLILAEYGSKKDEHGNIIKVGEIESDFMSYGSPDDAQTAAFSRDSGSNKASIRVKLRSRNVRTIPIRTIIEDLRPKVEKLVSGRAIVRFSMGKSMGSGSDITLDIFGHDLQVGVEYAKSLADAFTSQLGYIKDIEISQKLARPELSVKVNREKASNLGLNVSDIANAVELYFSGNKNVKYRESGDEYDINVRLRPEDRQTTSSIEQLYITTPGGKQVQLGNLVEVSHGTGPTSIERSEQQRYIQLTASVQGTDPGTAIREATKVINSVPIPQNFSWEFSGNEKDRRKSFSLLLQAACLGIMLVYMVMASQFESLLAPFIIALSVPFGGIGAMIMLLVVGSRISVVSLLGMIILIGIVVNNGIVLISYVNILITRGRNTKEALIEAGKSRLRPILSTTTTTILGMLPMAVSTGDGAESWVPMGWTVIGGMVVSTLMTLLLMPTLYSLMQRWLVPADQRSKF